MIKNPDIHNVSCNEDKEEAFYSVNYSSNSPDKVKVKKLSDARLNESYYETIILFNSISAIVCAKSEEHALEKALQLFKDYFENISKEIPEAIYKTLNNREKVWYAKFIPATKILKLTCIKEIPVGYSHNLVFVEEEGGYPKFFAFVKAKEYDAAWENAFILFRDYINDCNDTLDYIDSENCTRASRKE